MQVFAHNSQTFVELDKDMISPSGRDLLIEIKAISINPIDTKVKQTIKKDETKVLGYDAAGVVVALGDEVSMFEVGDAVFYAGDLTRDGSNAAFQLVDERLVAHKPKTLDFKESAALPLTSITAWESLFDRLKITQADQSKSLLLIGAAGGVGSMAIQLAKHKIGLNVIATASRESSKNWCLDLGADVVINHHDLVAEFKRHNLASPAYILCMGHPDQYFDQMAELIAPQGSICLLVNAAKAHDINLLKLKSVTLVWEMMFTRSMFQTNDMIEQHNLLTQLAEMIDQGQIKTTLTKTLSPINLDNIIQAHALIESEQMIGKLVISNP